MLDLRLFGMGQATFHGRHLAGFPEQKPFQLFCYLVLHRQHRHRRELLAAVFWGDHSTKSSRKQLRNALWRLRRCFAAVGAQCDNYLQIEDDVVGFREEYPYRLDVDMFDATLARHQSVTGNRLSQEQASEIEAAIELYDGELLQGMCEDWCLHERERLHLLYLDALCKLMLYRSSQGDYQEALNYGQLILDCDSTREQIHRQIMRLYWLVGDRPAALAQYHRCAQILWEEFGLATMEQTRLLYELIRQNEARTRNLVVAGSQGLALARATDVDTQQVVKQMLPMVHALQESLEKAGTELQSMQDLLVQCLVNSDSTLEPD